MIHRSFCLWLIACPEEFRKVVHPNFKTRLEFKRGGRDDLRSQVTLATGSCETLSIPRAGSTRIINRSCLASLPSAWFISSKTGIILLYDNYDDTRNEGATGAMNGMYSNNRHSKSGICCRIVSMQK